MDTLNDTRLSLTFPDGNSVCVVLSGNWHLHDTLPDTEPLRRVLDERPDLTTLSFDSHGVTDWDTSLPILITRLLDLLADTRVDAEMAGLPEGVRTLVEMARATPAIEDTGRHADKEGLLALIGTSTQRMLSGLPEALHFIGEAILSLGRLVRGRAQFRTVDLFFIIQQVGPNALPIVSLVSFLVGLILAYMGAVQLERVGAPIYIADLVSIAMVREVGALMTGIIMAGRTGASYAAELGTMQVNEEIDAYRTLGISTMDFLVMPRLLALVSMIPLLTLYAGLVGTLAGMFIAVLVFDISLFEYYQQTLRALEFKQFIVGIGKGTIYGIVIAISGCLRGMQCGRSALAVGEATTSAVVTSIVYIVITASAMTVMLYKLDI